MKGSRIKDFYAECLRLKNLKRSLTKQEQLGLASLTINALLVCDTFSERVQLKEAWSKTSTS